MVGHHVPQRAGIVKVSAAPLHPHRFRIRNLYVIDVAPIPDRLEDGVVEAEHHDVLHCLFTQIMINTVDLVFLQNGADAAVQSLGGFKILPEWLLNHYAAPVSVFLL